MKIFRDFSTRTVLPVSIDEVKEYILSEGAVDGIVFHEVEGDPAVFRGFCQHYETIPRPYASPLSMVQIAVVKGLPEPEKRLVTVKELLHVFDKPNARTATPDQVSRLIDEIVAPQGLALSLPGRVDRAAEILALMVLLPKAAVDAFRPLVAAGLISPAEVAIIARIPAGYGQFVFSEQWREVLDRYASEDQ